VSRLPGFLEEVCSRTSAKPYNHKVKDCHLLGVQSTAAPNCQKPQVCLCQAEQTVGAQTYL